MMEGLGLAVSSETPVVVADVMRGGPSTGIPTKSEQSDLDIALHGLHGDAPHLVLAALDVRDCVLTFHWAVRLAEHLQTAAIVLTDQSLGQSRAIVDPPDAFQGDLPRVTAEGGDQPYARYALTDSGISPMATPGQPRRIYTADGLEHNQRGIPSSAAADHLAQLAKRQRKLRQLDFGAYWADIRGAGETCLITWGSVAGAVREAAQRLDAAGRPTRVLALRLICPLQREAFAKALAGVRDTFVIEQNQGAHLFHYLHGLRALPPGARSLARPGPLLLRPGEIFKAVVAEA
jgi:2-oxoglutarate ferredoxin oxidoreductase subunit alpha